MPLVTRHLAPMLVGLLLIPTLALARWSQQGEGLANFKAVGPAGFKILGKTKAVDVSDDGKSLTVTIKLADLDTDNGLRDQHMLEDLEAAKFPTCSLGVPLEALKEGASNAQAKGTFSLHGKSKEVPFTYTATCTGGVCDVEGTADVNLKDYDVKVRSYLGITVKPEVRVAARFQVKSE